jgi:flavorubredoxin
MTVQVLHPDALLRIGATVTIDDRLSWRAPGVTGTEPISAYLVLDDSAAVLVYTGVAAHREAVLDGVRGSLGGRSLSILIDRNEPDVVGNMRALLDGFDVQTIWYAGAGQILHWFEHDGDGPYSGHAQLKYLMPRGPNHLPSVYGDRPDRVVLPSGRTLLLVHTLLTTLGHSWTYDGTTRTLFTGDFLAHGVAGDPGDAVLNEATDTTTYELVRDHLFQRLYWIADAHPRPLLDSLDAVFGAHEIDRVAPAHGCVLEGGRLIAEHLDWVRRAIVEGPGPDTTGGL